MYNSKLLEKQQWPKYRLKQINHLLFKELIADWSDATTLPHDLRQVLSEISPVNTLTVVDEKISRKKDTIKTLFALPDGNMIESVLMMHENRNTVCVSCQAGCAVGCVFCATGRMGLKRNLTSTEIVDQVLYFARKLKVGAFHESSPREHKISNIVFMGMGEPMLNIDNVSQAVTILTDNDMFGMGKRKITVSTSGYFLPLKKFLRKFPHIGLAISLHAPDQELREKLMPNVAKKNPLKDLLKVCRDYSNETKRRVSYEYLLIEGVNDSLAQARKLAEILYGHLFFVNLIPYNPPTGNCGVCFKKPNTMRVNRFKDELNKLRVPVAVRVAMGADIGGACGQLSSKK